MTTPQHPFTYSPHLHQYALPLSTFAAQNPQHTHFVVGGHIFTSTYSRSSTTPSNPEAPAPKTRVLLLRRSKHDSYPGFWEGPGGLCEPTDSSILSGAAREVYEESGLRVTHFQDLIGVHEWTRVKSEGVVRAAKFTFLALVEEAKDGEGWEGRVRLEPDEHEEFVWATEGEVREGLNDQGEGADGGRRLKFVGDQGPTLLRGFRLFEGRGDE
ncbi:hypothetical protein P170DRAFT_511224 [Aspergillus steynii IBT 23096]|uniref:Nudix hydrolase domain-containing protein n=1 Tax=Aspergillus steynii IBT 23096 TaxID=1392250 RepID=A0A2I2G0P4_9EURO|nr:uncharacterized protein P170DRAFT_511224 [Aspergillus steynii IBT 23096]PLB46454.1 hypothetical protein P170DRAFT_511224 [Aspergillus steynii IBT 23096]